MKPSKRRELATPRGQAYWLLRAGFTAAPILAGLDKFSERMTRWEKYLSPAFASRAPVSPRTFMKTVGVIEIAAGTLVATKPRVGSYLVAGWLGGIITNLLLHPKDYTDIALRDLGLALGAVALGRLEAERAEATLPKPRESARFEEAFESEEPPIPQLEKPEVWEALAQF